MVQCVCLWGPRGLTNSLSPTGGTFDIPELLDRVSVLTIHVSGAQRRSTVSRTKHVWYSEHGTYYRFEFILEQAMSVTHVAVILRTRTSPAYEEEFMKMDYPDARNEYGML